MTDLTLPMPLGAAPTFAVDDDVTRGGDFADTQPSHIAVRGLPIAFTGSGSEYFRIWIVNLLLTLVTLGIYYPWAKVRRLRYFHGNTLVGGEPLGFHADPKKMLKGYLLVSALLALYSVAGHFSAVAGAIAFIAVMLIWPALLKSSMQFRLANTSWRGLRFRFTGDLRGAYAAMIPLFVPALCLVVSLAFVPNQEQPPMWYIYATMGVMAGLLLLSPWLFQRLKAYQHNHYALGAQHTQFSAGVGSFYKLFGKVVVVYLGISALLGILVTVVILLVVFVGGASGNPFAQGANNKPVWLIAAAMFGFAALMLLFVSMIKPYVATRMQNLVWTNTQSEDIRFHSRLKARAMMWLSAKNWLLVVITLGLYWPFAAIARARMQLEAVSIASQISLDSLVNRTRNHEGEAAGDAAGDLFGLDIGF
ncbi:MAG: YjgN family protein [Pseudomonadota bacterium]